MSLALRRKIEIFVSGAGIFLLIATFSSPLAFAQKHRYAPDVEQRIDMAGRMSKEGNFEEARRVLQEALRMDGNCCECFNNLGITFFKEGRLKDAEGNFRRALNIDALYLEALCNLGLCLYQQGESHYDEAIVYFRQALELTKNNDAQLHKNLADVLRDKGDFKEAAKHYGDAVRLQNDYAPAYNGLSMLYYRLKQYDKAYDEAQKAVKFRPDYALGYFYLGMIETARKRIPEAIGFYETSAKYEPNPRYAADTRQKIADLKAGLLPPGDSGQFPGAQSGTSAPGPSVTELVRSQEWARAEAELGRMISVPRGKSANNYNNYGYVLSRQGKYLEAAQAYKKAIATKKGSFPQAHYNLGQVLRLTNEKREAEKEFALAIHESQQLKKPFPAAFNAYAMLLKSRGDLNKANKNYHMALAQAGDTMPVIHYNLAILLEKSENSRDAVREYKRYLALSPGGKNARQAKERLKRLTGDVK